MLRSRRSRHESRLDGRLPAPIVEVESDDADAPAEQALLADSVGVALLVVLETLGPTERLAFVLHDMFAVPFGEIAEIVGRSPAATRQLVSRARHRVQGASPAGRPDRVLQRRVVDAFLAASRAGDFDALVEVLDPDVVFRVDPGRGVPMMTVSGAAAAARLVMERGVPVAPFARPALVNGTPGSIVRIGGRLVAVTSFTVVDERITEIEIFADPEGLAKIDARLG
jgi:RNA polymerase sigma-70 factor (ECF subfamily)